MAAYLVQFFDGDTLAVAVQRLGRNVCKQVSGQPELMDALEFGAFLQHTLQSNGTSILLQAV